MILIADHGIWDWTSEDDGFVPIDFTKSKAVAVFLKACDGKWDTPYYTETIAMARSAGKLAAPYVWLYARKHTDPKIQADFWYLRLKNEPLIAVDFERWSTYYPDYDDLYNAVERLLQLGYMGKIIIYTNYWYWLVYGRNDLYWAKFPVWLARYGSTPPQVTPPWIKETIWQFSASGNPADYGITNGKLAVDENWFYGTQEELEELFGGVVIPPEPPGGDMYKGTVITASLNVRNAPVTGTVINGLSLNNLVEADRIENGWWHLTKIRGVVTIGENWAYEGLTKNYIRTDVQVGNVTLILSRNGTTLSTDTIPAGGTVTVAITS